MRKKITNYVVVCDSCYSHINGKVYREKDLSGKVRDMCEACYLKYFGTTAKYVWFKIKHWIFVPLGSVIVFSLYRFWGGDVYECMMAVAMFCAAYYFVVSGRGSLDRRIRRKEQYLLEDEEENNNEE
jgi:hypothetical protein